MQRVPRAFIFRSQPSLSLNLQHLTRYRQSLHVYSHQPNLLSNNCTSHQWRRLTNESSTHAITTPSNNHFIGQSSVTINQTNNNGFQLHKILKSIVKINVITASEGHLPWQRNCPSQSSGSGFIVRSLNDPNKMRIVTNAHVVASDTMVRVEKYGSSKNFIAKVISRSYECDVAILSVEEDEDQFYQGCCPLEWDTVPHLQDTVYVVGHPSGASGVCFTKGVISRFSMIDYNTGGRTFFNGDQLLAFQVDAAVNPGNSGGPLLSSDYKVKGIVFQKSLWEENQGYCIPAEVALHFLKTDDKSLEEMNEREKEFQKKYRSRTASYKFPMLDFQFQNLDNDQLQKYSGLYQYNRDNNTQLTGVYIKKINPLSEAAKVLREGDVVCEIDGFKIDDHGEVLIDFSNQPTLRVLSSKEQYDIDDDDAANRGHNFPFTYLLKRKFIGDKYSMKILRDQQLIDMELTANVYDFLLEPASDDRIRSYLIVGGFVFESATNNSGIRHSHFSSIGHYDPENRSTMPPHSLHNWRSYPDEELVYCSHILAHKTNATYLNEDEDLIEGSQLIKFNGVLVRNMKHLNEMIANNEKPLLAFEMAGGAIVVLDSADIDKTNKEILKEYDIRSLHSKDLKLPKPQ